MKWFDRWFFKKCIQAWENSSNERNNNFEIHNSGVRARRSNVKISNVLGVPQRAPQEPSIDLRSNPMVLKVYPASGGWVVEYSYYNNDHEEDSNSLHLIHNDEELGIALERIITIEALKK